MEKLSLTDFRKRHGFTQQELADRLKVSRNYIALVENGHKPFSQKLMDKLSLVNTGTVRTENTAPPSDKASSDDCPRCAEKDVEIEWLRAQLSKAQDNLAAALASKPSPAAGPACGALDGAVRERKRA